MTGNTGFLEQLIGELEKRDGSSAQHAAHVADSTVRLPLTIAGNFFSTPIEAIAAPAKELTDGMSELSLQVKSLRDATQASVENVENNTKALEFGLQAIRSLALGGGQQAGLGPGSALSLFPLFKGIRSLFGGDDEEPQLPNGTTQISSPPREYSLSGAEPLSYSERGAARSPVPQQIHVHVQTMDSRSFADNSEKIAEAVRTAMLQSGALSDVWGEY